MNNVCGTPHLNPQNSCNIKHIGLQRINSFDVNSKFESLSVRCTTLKAIVKRRSKVLYKPGCELYLFI